MKGHWSQNLQYLLGNGKKWLCKKKNRSLGQGQDQQKHPAVHTGELAGGGSVAVAVGVTDM